MKAEAISLSMKTFSVYINRIPSTTGPRATILPHVTDETRAISIDTFPDQSRRRTNASAARKFYSHIAANPEIPSIDLQWQEQIQELQ